MLYLHGNKISSFSQLARLTLLPNLYSLTLHGYKNSSLSSAFPAGQAYQFQPASQSPIL
jgi:hypothetical protein